MVFSDASRYRRLERANCQSAPRYMDRRLAAHRKSSAAPQQIGTMQWEAPMPAFSSPKLTLLRSDDFDSEILGPQWQWNHQPRKDFFSLTERPGWVCV